MYLILGKSLFVLKQKVLSNLASLCHWICVGNIKIISLERSRLSAYAGPINNNKILWIPIDFTLFRKYIKAGAIYSYTLLHLMPESNVTLTRHAIKGKIVHILLAIQA